MWKKMCPCRYDYVKDLDICRLSWIIWVTPTYNHMHFHKKKARWNFTHMHTHTHTRAGKGDIEKEAQNWNDAARSQRMLADTRGKKQGKDSFRQTTEGECPCRHFDLSSVILMSDFWSLEWWEIKFQLF